MKLRAWCTVVALSLAGPAAIPASAQSKPPSADPRVFAIGKSTAVRLNWNAFGSTTDDYVIKRSVADDKDGFKEIGHSTSTGGGALVFVDDSSKKLNVEYRYLVVQGEGKGPGSEITIKEASSTLQRYDLFDDDQVKARFSDLVSKVEGEVGSDWTISQGKVTWTRREDKKSAKNVWLSLEADKPVTEVIARLSINRPAAPSDAKVGIGILTADETLLYSACLQREDDKTIVLRLFKEEKDGANLRAIGSSQEFGGEMATSVDAQIWLKLLITGNTVQAVAWSDAVGPTSDDKDELKSVQYQSNTVAIGATAKKAVLMGGDRELLANFGEVYIEDVGGPPSVTIVEKPTPDPESGGANQVVVVEDEENRCLRDCPKIADLMDRGFDGLPTVVRLQQRGSVSANEDADVAELEHRLEICDPCSRAFDFAAPARFTIPRFGSDGSEYEEDGALIYEGMRFVASPQGAYEVRFLISTPAMPMTLRLRLDLPCPKGCGHSVTLPPIELPPYMNPQGRFEPATWRVRHVGFANFLVRPEPKLRESPPSSIAKSFLEKTGGNCCELFPKAFYEGRSAIRRSGVARFGTVPVIVN